MIGWSISAAMAIRRLKASASEDARMADGVVFRCGIAARDQPLHHPGDHAVVLGMGADHRAGFARRDQDIEQRLVVDLAAGRRS